MKDMHDINLDLLEVRPSKIRGAGDGAFALTMIPAGTLIGPYKGRYMNAKQRLRLLNSAYLWKIHDDRFVDAIRHTRNNPLRYVNGSKTDVQKARINCVVKFLGDEPDTEKVYYMTSRNILPGEELIVSYGDNYFIKKKKCVQKRETKID